MESTTPERQHRALASGFLREVPETRLALVTIARTELGLETNASSRRTWRTRRNQARYFHFRWSDADNGSARAI